MESLYHCPVKYDRTAGLKLEQKKDFLRTPKILHLVYWPIYFARSYNFSNEQPKAIGSLKNTLKSLHVWPFQSLPA